MKARYLPCRYDLLATAFILALTASASAHSHANGPLSHPDSSFMKNAAEDNLEEIKLGNMAEQQGSSETVKRFAKRMVDDHSKLNADLETLAARKSFTLPYRESASEKASDKPLDWKNGPDFDKAYISDMVEDHGKAAALFQAEIKNGKDSDVKALAAQQLPIIQDQIQSARRAAQEIGASVS